MTTSCTFFFLNFNILSSINQSISNHQKLQKLAKLPPQLQKPVLSTEKNVDLGSQMDTKEISI